ncbi:MAG: response regulator [Chloroflexi bacterium]|nr:MAG: response regulator [Chloroflexota bacterium]
MSKKILIVEDDSDIRAALVAWLEDEDFEVAEATDGVDGLAEFKRFQPDLALLDMNMPGLNGIELCTVLRQITDVPLIMFTAAGDLDAVEEAIARGATDFVLKDTGFDELVNRISGHLNIERQNISKAEFDDAYPAQVVKTPEPQSGGIGQTIELDAADGPGTPESPFAGDLWTWSGDYFGFRDGQNLWTYEGRHVGRFRRDEIFRPDGLYMGDLVDGRLVVDWHKTARRASSFTPSENRGGHTHFADREPFDMMLGYKDFPGPDQI